MRPIQWVLLAASVAFGIAWTYQIQNKILYLVFPGMLLGPGMNLQGFLDSGSSPAFTVLWWGCFVALIIWVITTMTSRPHSSKDVRSKQPLWWLAASILVGFGWLCLGWFTVFTWQVTQTSPIANNGVNFFPVPTPGWILLIALVLVDVILLFWLPTLLASPRTYRFVVPGAVKILGNR
jgi:hypothetical protein